MRKKYTLYYKGINKYGHDHNLPIVSLELKELDEYTSNYENYYDLFNCLPKTVKDFVIDNLMYRIDFNDIESFNNCFFITDNDFNPMMNVIFEEDEDVLYVTSDELDKMIVSEKMSYLEFRSCMFNLKRQSVEKKKYDFFKYLYETYVEGQKIETMIDVYDANSKLPDLNARELMIAALSTSRDNIIILCKKLCQSDEARRNLAFKYKELFNKINSTNKMMKYKTILERKEKRKSFKYIADMILDNFEEFKAKYDREYKD